MTKEELERIKVAYHSGLKVQIWFNGNWENFDAREYSMYKDPFSENRQYRIVGSDYADMAEKRIADLEKENADLEEQLENDRDLPAIAYMQGAEKQKKKDEEELKKWKDEWQEQVQKATDEGYARTLQTIQLTKAKHYIKELARAVEHSYSVLSWQRPPIKAEAEQFLKDSEVEK